jgi:hypothetical protein
LARQLIGWPRQPPIITAEDIIFIADDDYGTLRHAADIAILFHYYASHAIDITPIAIG